MLHAIVKFLMRRSNVPMPVVRGLGNLEMSRNTEKNAVISLYVVLTRGAMKKSFARMSLLTWRPRVSGL